MTTALKAGVGRTDITPPLGTLLMGYADPHGERKATTVRDPLQATALVFESGDCRAVVVSLDVIVIDDQTTATIRAAAQERTGIAAANITLCATQTHSGPRTFRTFGWSDPDQPYLDDIMVPNVVDAIDAAAASLAPARVGIAEIHSEVGVNRRVIQSDHGIRLGVTPYAPFDPTMTVLRIDNTAGTLANLVHYGAHPTVFASANTAVSRDWPGIMIDRVEELTGAPTLYINGAVGDIAPRSNSMGAVGDGETALWEVGTRAAMDAMAAWRSIRDLRDVSVFCEVASYELPYRPLTQLAEAQERLAAATPDKDKPGRPMAEYLHCQAVVAAHDEAPQSGRIFQQCVTAIGPVALVPMPGEPFAEIVLRLRQASRFQHTLCASTSCGSNGYLCTRESQPRGGYETWIGCGLGAYLLAENVDDALVEENLKLLERLFAQVYPPLG